MSEEVKKISFGFSKFVKKTSIVSNKLNKPKTDDKVEFIDCLEGKSIKLKDPVETKDTVLVIPLKKELKDDIVTEQAISKSLEARDKQVEVDSNKSLPVANCEESVKFHSGDSVPEKNETLDEIAAREIVEELNKKEAQEETRIFSVPLTTNAPIGEAESSLDDYENIPVTQFGLAMLRGMGWAPGKGIGKNEKVAKPSVPTLRPKGMGLGADKVIKGTDSGKSMGINQDLKMAKGSFVRIVAGIHKDSYGQIEGFDEESGRMIVKLALNNTTISLNEFMAHLVDKTEFLKNSKVINMGKYEQYKDDENKKELPTLTYKNDNRGKVTSSESELCEPSRRTSPQNSRDKYVRNRSSTPEDISRSKYSHSKSHAGSDIVRQEMKSGKNRRSHSRSSVQTNSSSDSSDRHRKKYRSKKKKPSSHRHKSRTRSRSPKYHSNHKKHKKRK